MAQFALVEDGTDALLKLVDGDREFRTGSPPTLTGKGMRWLPFVLVKPAFDPVTHVTVGPVDVAAAEFTRTWTVRAKTAQEIDDEKDIEATSIMAMRGLKILVQGLNDGTFVPGAGLTNAQLKAYFKSKL